MASLWCSRRYRLERSLTLARRTTFLHARAVTPLRRSCKRASKKIWNESLQSSRVPLSYPLLPVLEARFWSAPFCRSWLFMMASCLCLSSMSLALTSSSTHTSDESHSRSLDNGRLELTVVWILVAYMAINTFLIVNITIQRINLKLRLDSPRGVSSRTDFAFKLAPLATSSSTIWIC